MHFQFARLHSTALFLIGLLGFTGLTAHAVTGSVPAGQPVNLAVTASGTAPFTYKWYKDGALLSGASSATYAIASFQSANAGAYYAVVSNSLGSTTSDTATLSVGAAGSPTAVSIWTTAAAPARADAGADSAVELGVKFKSDVAGTITGIRFYKAATNTGAHVGHLWTSGGALLASATFSGETASGWQQVNLGSPVAIAANTVYVVSYSCAAGHYSSDLNYFASGVDHAPLHALANGVSGSDGLYAYGTGGVFPASSWSSCNYWVDVAFQASGAATLTSLAVTPASSTVTVGATPQFTATATYSDATTQNVASQATWASSNTTVATVSTGGLATTKAAGASTISATFSGVTGSATLTVNAATVAPAFTTQPASQVVTAGGSVTFTAAASGTPAPSYQWRKNGTNLSGATAASFAIAGVALGDAGTYSVVATNSAGSATSAGALLTVNPLAVAPVIVTPPLSQTVTTGSNVTFSVVATGVPTPTYQWRKNGTNISGATAGSYALTNVAAGNAGTYTVVATNSAGSATSAGAVLTVNAATSAPVITTQPVSQTVTVGANVTFTAAASGSPAPSYQWRKNGTAISGATSSSYALTNVATGNAGTYTVVATNSVGSATSAGAVLTVNAASGVPVITTQPVNQTVVAGSKVTFSVVATGTPAPAYQWKFNGNAISGANSASYSMNKVTSASAGLYYVVVSNSAGSVTSAGAVLTVNAAASAPVITTQPVSQTVAAGGSVTFTAAASGTPTPTYQWRKNGTAISGATSAAYKMTGIATGNAGTYTVVATNSAGSATSAGAVLTVTAAVPPSVRFDFNGDGKSDIVWRSATTGVNRLWLMSGTAVSSTVALDTVSTDWQLAATGDINGDGKLDLIWQNSVTGEAYTWLMAGTTPTTKASLGSASLDWLIIDTGDFNGDGKADLLWRNRLTGECSAWLMAGTTVTSKPSLGTLSTDWLIIGTGDFNGDGKADILWRNSVTGQNLLWLMNGATVSSTVALDTVSVDWQIVDTGDFNGDGKLDILWQNDVTSEAYVWLMAGTSVTTKASLGIAGTGWEAIRAVDFNGDGKADILWQNSLTNEVYVWLMNGTTTVSKGSLGTMTADWIIRN